MSIWICKKNDISIDSEYENFDLIENGDTIYIYWDDFETGSFILKYKLERNEDILNQVTHHVEVGIDLPYSILYKTKASNRVVKLEENEIRFILNEDEETEEEFDEEVSFIHVNPSLNGKLDFVYKNILLKGVPGTGKSYLIDETLIKDKLKLNTNDKNVLRINIHSASSNADLMQGIGINTTASHDIEYKEKQGLIFDHLQKAILHPQQAFVLVLEEIQENSLNELIGDLIYLIEPSKRTDIAEYVFDGTNIKLEYNGLDSIDTLIDKIVSSPTTAGKIAHYVEIPSLVSTEIKKRKMIFPDNLYVFCTSNFREDKKVIEDNLLRRFDTIEIYPNYNNDLYKKPEVARFLSSFNDEVLKKMEGIEVHPDRFIIGHAIWQKVEDKKTFYRALLKVVVEFKDVKELEYEDNLKSILSKMSTYPFGISQTDIEKNSYKDLIEYLQGESYDFLPANNITTVVENSGVEGILGATDEVDVSDDNVTPNSQQVD